MKTRRPCWKAATAIEAAVVLLPLPPFCVTNETTLMPLPSHSGVMASWLTRTPLPPEAANGGLTVPVDLPEGGWPPCQKTSKRGSPQTRTPSTHDPPPQNQPPRPPRVRLGDLGPAGRRIDARCACALSALSHSVQRLGHELKIPIGLQVFPIKVQIRL